VPKRKFHIFLIRSMFSSYYIPLGMYRSVENEAPAELLRSVGMQPHDLPNVSISTECSFV
jgi:hypothetical protein